MKKPVLVIMAAGMGSRYGGLKQMDPVDAEGHLIIDYSIFDAIKAGFGKIVFVIKHEIEQDFKKLVGERIAGRIDVEYVLQEISALPIGFEVPEGRVKPWGTGHAVLSCIGCVDGPFAVINADDYYGFSAFDKICRYLEQIQEDGDGDGDGDQDHDHDDKYRYTMVGYVLENTLTENGHVARGVCSTDANGMLQDIQEKTRIERHGDKVEFTEDDGRTWTGIAADTTVSMNMWGFGASMLSELKERFPRFLENEMKKNPLKSEYFLPAVVDELLKENKATVKVLKSLDKWYGVTYKEDKAKVMEAMEAFRQQGLYPRKLWE